MTGRAEAAIQADRRRVRRASVRAGLWVALASAVVVAVLSALTIAALFATSRPEHGPDRRPEGGPQNGGPPPGRVIDLTTAVPIAVVVGLLGVIALGAMSWYLAGRVAQPLAAALEVQRSFVADASHELRTPLTTLSSRIQLAQHRAAHDGDVAGALADLRRDAAVMDAVLTDLLLTAESAGSAEADAVAEASVAEVARESVSVLEPRAVEAGVAVRVEMAESLAVAADRVALQRALTALLDNALRYAPHGSTIDVTAIATGKSVDIRVVDRGPGIVGIDPERVFERFARAEGVADGGGRRGFGLGLALVRDLAHRFGGSVVVEETSSGGTTFLLSLPAAGTRRSVRGSGTS